MNKEENKKIDDILNSLDGVQKAVAPDFFYTRLKARMEKGHGYVVSKSWGLRPVYAIAALIVVLLINVAVIIGGQNANKDAVTESDTLQSVAAEYVLNDNSTNLYDLNLDK